MSRTHRTSSLQIKVSKEKVVGKLKEKRAIRVLFCVILRMVSSWDWDSFYNSYSEKKSPSSLLRMLTLHTLVSVLWYARMRVTLKLWQEDPRVLPKKRIWRHIEPELRDLFFLLMSFSSAHTCKATKSLLFSKKVFWKFEGIVHYYLCF